MMQSIFHGEIVHIHNIEFEYVDIVQYYNGEMVFFVIKKLWYGKMVLRSHGEMVHINNHDFLTHVQVCDFIILLSELITA